MPNEPADVELERRHRRLLLAYPGSYRRYRGDEMVATPAGRRGAGSTWNYGFSAHRDGVVLTVAAYRERDADPAVMGRTSYLSITIEISRIKPSLASMPVAVGAGLGLLGGWWFVTALSRRIDRLPRSGRTVAVVVSSVALAVAIAAWPASQPVAEVVRTS